MPQGKSKLKNRRENPRTGQKKSNTVSKGTRVFKPKKASLASKHNVHKKLTAAIARNIEKETSQSLSRNGGKLSLLKKVAQASKNGGDEASDKAQVPKFNTRKQFRLTS